MHLPRFGRRPERQPMAHPHPLMQASIDGALPYWVASDHAIWGTFTDIESAVHLADLVAQTQPVGERIVVSHWGITSYTTTGHNHATVVATGQTGQWA